MLLQVCRRNGRNYIRRAAEQSLSADAKTPRQLYVLAEATEAATNTFGSRSVDGRPPQNRAISEAVGASPRTNPYPRTLPGNIKKQEKYLSMISDEVLDTLDTAGELPSIAENLMEERRAAMTERMLNWPPAKRLKPETEMMLTAISRFRW